MILRQLVIPQSHLQDTVPADGDAYLGIKAQIWSRRSAITLLCGKRYEEGFVAIAISITVPVGEGVRGRLLVGQWQTEPNMAFHTLPWAVAHLVPTRNQGNRGKGK